MGFMTQRVRPLRLLPAVLGVVCGSAQADWTLLNDNGGDGYVDGAVPAFTLHGSDNGASDNGTVYAQVFSSATPLTFSWKYTTEDCCGAYWDPAGYVLNGNYVQLSPDVEGPPGTGNSSGTLSISIAANDSFGWYVFSPDSAEGRGVLAVSVVPEAPTALLAASGLALMMWARRRSCQV